MADEVKNFFEGEDGFDVDPEFVDTPNVTVNQNMGVEESTKREPMNPKPEEVPIAGRDEPVPTYDNQVERLIDVSQHCMSEAKCLRSVLFADVVEEKGGIFGRDKSKRPDKSPQVLSDAISIAIETLEEASSILVDLSRDVKCKLGSRRL